MESIAKLWSLLSGVVQNISITIHIPSISLQTVSVAIGRFIVNVGRVGRQTDSGCFRSSSLYKFLEKGTLNVPSPHFLPGTTITLPYAIVATKDAHSYLISWDRFPKDNLTTGGEFSTTAYHAPAKVMSLDLGFCVANSECYSKQLKQMLKQRH